MSHRHLNELSVRRHFRVAVLSLGHVDVLVEGRLSGGRERIPDLTARPCRLLRRIDPIRDRVAVET